jgi:ABC-type Na+ transport system ATPase subunit NatA
MHAIRVARLTKRYGSTVALDGVTFGADPGRVTGFLGRNGAGKMTTLRILVGLAAPTSGSTTIGGLPYRAIANPSHHVGALVDRNGFRPLRTMHTSDGLVCIASEAGVFDLPDASVTQRGRLGLLERRFTRLARAMGSRAFRTGPLRHSRVFLLQSGFPHPRLVSARCSSRFRLNAGKG